MIVGEYNGVALDGEQVVGSGVNGVQLAGSRENSSLMLATTNL